MSYTIKEVAERTNISAHVLRYYEKEGVLPRIDRSQGGSRRYTDEDLDLLGLITCLKNTGMPLKDIRTFVQLREEGPVTLAQRRDILKAQQQNVLERLEEMRMNYEKVTKKLAYYDGLLAERQAEGAKK
ncbi:MAG: MerR family transcriptional regulator [Clostridia bacterium]|nr:MerR family transcriptional regulator [Clostridia bacterium]